MTPSAIAQRRLRPLSLVQKISAALALFVLALEQFCRAKRSAVVLLLFGLPVVFAIVARSYRADVPPDQMEFALVFTFIPHALAPLAALLYASGIVQDEVEDQTLTYLLVRPLARWLIFAGKLLAALVVTCILVNLLAAATFTAIYWGTEGFWNREMAGRVLWTMIAVDLALLAYNAVFACLSLLVKRTLVVGVAYIVIFEGLIANIPFLVREATVMYYYRVLNLRWLGLDGSPWMIELRDAPEAKTCVLVLLGASVLAAALGAMVFTAREFRLKTPEGS